MTPISRYNSENSASTLSRTDAIKLKIGRKALERDGILPTSLSQTIQSGKNALRRRVALGATVTGLAIVAVGAGVFTNGETSNTGPSSANQNRLAAGLTIDHNAANDATVTTETTGAPTLTVPPESSPTGNIESGQAAEQVPKVTQP